MNNLKKKNQFMNKSIIRLEKKVNEIKKKQYLRDYNSIQKYFNIDFF